MRESMAKGSIAYHLPSPMTVGVPETIRLDLSYTALSAEMRRKYSSSGVQGGQDKVPTTRVMTARLNVDDKLRVVSDREQTKPISETKGMAWEWTVAPQMEGNAVVELVLIAYGKIDGEKIADPYTVFSDTVTIQLKPTTWLEKVLQWVAEILNEYAKTSALAALGAITAACWAWLRKRNPKRP